MSQTTHLTFVQTALGLEALLAAELRALLPKIAPPSISEGGVLLRLSVEQLWTLCLGSRLAEGVRVRQKAFLARDFTALEAQLGRLPFAAYLAKGAPVEVRVVSHRSKLWHSGAVRQRVEKVLTDRFGVRLGDAEEGATAVYVRLTGDTVQVSIDAAGYRLHRRGYRTRVAQASVRETLAAAVVGQVLGGEGAPPQLIWDPFCGAGTLGIEALHLAHGRLAGESRLFAFENWPTHDAQAYASARAQLIRETAARAPAPDMRAILSDRAPTALESARENAHSAALGASCQFLLGDLTKVAADVPVGAAIVANPPYGKRLAHGGALESLMHLLDLRPDLRPCVLLLGGPARRDLSPHFRAAVRTKNGGQSVSIRILDRGQSP